MRDAKKKPRCNWRSFEEARNCVRSLGLKSNREWRDWSKCDDKPDDIPASPDKAYKDKGWAGWGDWLGTGIVASYRSSVTLAR